MPGIRLWQLFEFENLRSSDRSCWATLCGQYRDAGMITISSKLAGSRGSAATPLLSYALASQEAARPKTDQPKHFSNNQEW